MRRITISLTDELALALEHETRRREMAASAIAREALARHLGVEHEQSREPLFANLGGGAHRSPPRDLELLLERDWDARSRRR